MAALPAGGYAEQALVRASTAVAVPDDVAAPDATVLYSTYQTAHVGLHHRAHLREGEWLLVHGAASGVGAAAVELGVAAGARVIATAGGPQKTAYCRALGAGDVLDHRDADVYVDVMRITGGAGVDVAFDPVGGALGDVTRRVMAWEGRLLVIGFASGAIPTYPANHVLVKNYSVVGLHWGADVSHSGRAVIEAAHADLVWLQPRGRHRLRRERHRRPGRHPPSTGGAGGARGYRPAGARTLNRCPTGPLKLAPGPHPVIAGAWGRPPVHRVWLRWWWGPRRGRRRPGAPAGR